jgi:hypothetical protein
MENDEWLIDALGIPYGFFASRDTLRKLTQLGKAVDQPGTREHGERKVEASAFMGHLVFEAGDVLRQEIHHATVVTKSVIDLA